MHEAEHESHDPKASQKHPHFFLKQPRLREARGLSLVTQQSLLVLPCDILGF